MSVALWDLVCGVSPTWRPGVVGDITVDVVFSGGMELLMMKRLSFGN